MVLRSDERANLAEIERDEQFRGNVGKAIGTGVSLATASAGGHFASKVMPFLSKYIPAGLALKGINKVNPKLGAFLSKGQEMGLDLQEGLDFVKEKFQGQKETKKPAKESRNIIEQESPELHQFLEQEIAKGRPPLHAGAIAQNDKRFSEVIKRLSKKHKIDWSNILESIYGQETKALPQNQVQQSALTQEAMNPQGSQPQRPPSAEQQAQTQPQQAQPGQGQQALMAMLQKLQQARGGQ